MRFLPPNQQRQSTEGKGSMLDLGPKFVPACHTAAGVIDRYLLLTGRNSPANPSAAAAAVDRWDRQTGRWTDTRPFYRLSQTVQIMQKLTPITV